MAHRTVKQLAIIAIVSIALLKLYAELFETEWEKLLPEVTIINVAPVVKGLLHAVPFIYVALIVAAILSYARVAR